MKISVLLTYLLGAGAVAGGGYGIYHAYFRGSSTSTNADASANVKGEGSGGGGAGATGGSGQGASTGPAACATHSSTDQGGWWNSWRDFM